MNTLVKYISSLVFNALAHYNVSNRIEYIKLILRAKEAPSIQLDVTIQIKPSALFIISMQNMFSRRTAMRNRMEQEKLQYSFFDAVVGKDVDEQPHYAISRRSFEYLTPGSIGCWLSHYQSWLRIVDQDIDCCIILEDDVILDSNFELKLNNSLKSTPSEFDILFLNTGNNYNHNRRYIVNNELFIPYHIRNGTFAYILTLQGAKKLLNLVPDIQITRGGIDSAIGVLIRNKKIIAYHLINPLCWVDYSFGSFTTSK